MFKPLIRYLLWLLLAVWFALGIGGLRTPVELEAYAQTRALAVMSTDLSPDRQLLDEGHCREGSCLARKPPGVAAATLPFYALGRLFGELWLDKATDVRGLTAQITSLAASVAAATAVLLLALSGFSLGLRRWSSLTMAIIVATATPIASYGSRLATPAFGLLALSLAFYALLRLSQEDGRAVVRLMLGAGLGLMFLLGDEYLLVLPLLLLWSLLHLRRLLARPGNALAFLLPFLLALFVFFWHNQQAYGDWLSGPDGRIWWLYFWRKYYLSASLTSGSIWGRHLWPGLKFLLVSTGPMPLPLAMARELPESLRQAVFLGIFTWCPLLVISLLGGWALGRDPDVRGPINLLMVFFFAVVLMRAMAREIVPPDLYDAGVTLPFWVVWFLGLGFFVEYHLFAMRGFILRAILAVALMGALAVSAGNAVFERAQAGVGAAPKQAMQLAAKPPARLPSDLGEKGLLAKKLPAGEQQAFFLSTLKLADWVVREPKQLAYALVPGVNNLSLFLPILAVIGLAPFIGGGLVRGRLRRKKQEQPRPERREKREPEARREQDRRADFESDREDSEFDD